MWQRGWRQNVRIASFDVENGRPREQAASASRQGTGVDVSKTGDSPVSAAIECFYLRLMTSHEGKEHLMKRTAVIIGVAAAMGVFAPAAPGSLDPGVKQPIAKAKPAVVRPLPVLRTRVEGSQTWYRFGNTGDWMQ